METSKKIKQRLVEAGKRFWAGDNISDFIEEGEKQQLIDELAVKFEDVLQGLVIDTENDPNSMDTGRRLAKMYICLLYTSPSPRDATLSRMPSSA